MGEETHLPFEIEELHRLAVDNEQDSYIDPDTGFMVFTAYFHWKRGNCCGNACRHCPYNHANVRKKKKKPHRPPTPINTPLPSPSTVTKVFEGLQKFLMLDPSSPRSPLPSPYPTPPRSPRSPRSPSRSPCRSSRSPRSPCRSLKE